MSFKKIQKIDPYSISNPDSGYVYLGQDNHGLWEKDEYGNVWYIQSGNTYITVIENATTSGTSGVNGTMGSSGKDGGAGTSGTSGKSGVSGTSGSSGDGTSGSSGYTGSSGKTGSSGTSGVGSSGTSGSSGVDGIFYGSSGTSGYSGGYGAATRVWNFSSSLLPSMGSFWAGNDLYSGNFSLSLVNKIKINTTDLDNQSQDNWLNIWKTGTLKIEDKLDASTFGIYSLLSASNTKPTLTVNLISGFTNLTSNGNLIEGRDYLISFIGGIEVTGISSIINLPMPNVKLEDSHNILWWDNINNVSGGTATLKRSPVVITTDLTEELLSKYNVFVEMVSYKRRSKKGFIHSGGYIVSSPYYTNLTPYAPFKGWTRGGNHKYFNGTNSVDFGMDRPNCYQVTSVNQKINVYEYLSGRFMYCDVKYRDLSGNTESTLNTLIPISGHRKSGKNKPGKKYAFSPFYTSLYVSFRYILWDPDANNSRGQVISGPTSKIIKITHRVFPFLIDYTQDWNYYPRASINSKHVSNSLCCWFEKRV